MSITGQDLYEAEQITSSKFPSVWLHREMQVDCPGGEGIHLQAWYLAYAQHCARHPGTLGNAWFWQRTKVDFLTN